MTRAAAAWAELNEALLSHEPSCDGDPRFTAESDEHDAVLRTICARCPVQQQCADYARAVPTGGAWGYFGGVVRRVSPQMRYPRGRARPTR